MVDRRDFLKLLAAGSLSAGTTAGCLSRQTPPLPPGEMLGQSHAIGHRLRSGNFPPPTRTEKVGVLIVGAGIAGLSAGWKLARAGFSDYRIVELENEAGGNSRSGHSPVSAYPLAAHYLPLPTREAKAVRELLAETGVLQGDPDAASPRYDERFLCATPQERLFKDGYWHEGLLPRHGLAAGEREQQQRFQALMEKLKNTRGNDGRRVFALPMAFSSRDPRWLALDRGDFRSWLLAQGFTAPSLHWLANYACRDDYGTAHHETSAWAGLHYFACRSGHGENSADDTVLTAPEGNAWLTRALAAASPGRIATGQAVWRLNETPAGMAVEVFLPASNSAMRYLAEQVIWAGPLFLLPRLYAGLPEAERRAALAIDYAPWLIANLHLSDFPQERLGTPLAWDNVLHASSGLGYVVATHQTLRRHQRGTIFTCYRALHDQPPAAARRELLTTPREVWGEALLAELALPHPDIRELATRLDGFALGHAMCRPVPGSLWSGARECLAAHASHRLHLAHADLSGFSLFEEANYRGVLAAERVLTRLGVRHRSSLL